MTVFTRTTSKIQNQINNNLTKETPLLSGPPIEDFWRLETIGITYNPRQLDDEKTVQHLSETVKKENSRYNASWHWGERRIQIYPKIMDWRLDDLKLQFQDSSKISSYWRSTMRLSNTS